VNNCFGLDGTDGLRTSAYVLFGSPPVWYPTGSTRGCKGFTVAGEVGAWYW